MNDPIVRLWLALARMPPDAGETTAEAAWRSIALGGLFLVAAVRRRGLMLKEDSAARFHCFSASER